MQGMKVKLELNDNKIEFELDKAEQLEKLYVIQGIFKSIGVDNELSDMIDTYAKIGKAYNSFFSKIDNIEPEESAIERIHNNIEQIDSNLKESKRINITKPINKSEPEYFKTGIKEEAGVKKYRCRMKCKCGKEQNRYIKEDSNEVICSDCGTSNNVRGATEEGFPNRDGWGNFFVAGEFKRRDELANE